MEEKDMQNFFVNFFMPMMQKEKKDKVTNTNI